MPVNRSLLESHRSFTQEQQGFTERFEHVQLRSGSTVGVLGAPLGKPMPLGWLICHSFGAEHWNLSATEVAIGRALASAGFPVLRYHGQGYGDSERMDVVPSVQSHVDDALDAADALREISDVAAIGLIGAKFGGTVAMLAASRARADHLALVSPAVSGRRYVRELLRTRAALEVAGQTESVGLAAPEEGDLATLESGGAVNIRGFRLTPDVFEQIDRVDLLRVDPSAKAALIVQTSRTQRPNSSLVRLRRELTSKGVNVSGESVTGHYAALLGDSHFRPVEGYELQDTLTELNREIAEVVTRWASSLIASEEPTDGTAGGVR